jgi:ribonuclease E
MANKMLIDAAHPEETRVVVLRGNRVEEFDFESANRRQLRGNIYLAKVTRVEPSLQAAFVDYGGNRHGFLAFSEIHPDYYQIPVADRQALIAEDERAHRAAEAEQENRSGRSRGRRHERAAARAAQAVRGEAVEGAPEDGAADALIAQAQAEEVAAEHEAFDERDRDETVAPGEGEARHDTEANFGAPSDDMPAEERAESSYSAADDARSEQADDDGGEHAATDEQEDVEAEADERIGAPADEREASREPNGEDGREGEGEEEEEIVESVGGADAMEEVPVRAPRYRRQYKIQEVIKRRQIMLVQVVKEERGTKGAALTTYLSLAGRYSVLMPNTARGGGISRKITSAQDRARLKEAAAELEVPEGMGVILRTAGASRTPTEIKRDFEYLLRVWETVRDLTLKSTAPTLVYEEGSLVKRSIRDLYNKDIDEVIVAGEAAYREAKDFMRMLMPSHAKNVRIYRDSQPMFSRYGIESQLDAMFSPVMQLRSGGYIVLNQTEALVAIDVNSGRATREHHIEDTALKTNLEAAEEIARQLRLRDLAGLIVIDFIDMDEKRNNRAVERRLKDALRNDRARIQVGRISHFGLMEMSRQRIRTSVLESSTDKCSVCGGTGHVRSVSSLSLQLLRVIEETLLRGATHNLIVRTGSEVALYILNHKRGHLRDLENRFQLTITVSADPTMGGLLPFVIDKGEQVHSLEQARAIAEQLSIAAPEIEEEPEEEGGEPEAEELAAEEPVGEAEIEETVSEAAGHAEPREPARRRRRRRRRGRGGEEAAPSEGFTRDTVAEHTIAHEDHDSGEPAEFGPEAGEEITGGPEGEARPEHAGGEEDLQRRRRRRGRRGGRRNRREGGERPAEYGYAGEIPEGAEQIRVEPEIAAAVADLGGPPVAETAPPQETPPPPPPAAAEPQPERAEPRRRSTVREPVSFAPLEGTGGGVSSIAPAQVATPPEPSPAPAPAAAEEPKTRRTGWWAKRLLGE